MPALGAALSSLRLLRLFRLLRFIRFGMLLARALRIERSSTSTQTLRVVGLITVMVVVVVGGAAQATFDHGDFKSVWDGVWWAIVTVSTVGYGDLYPTTVGGRVIAILLMFAGIGFLSVLSVLTATIASRFVQADGDPEQKQILVKLDRIESELRDLKTRVGA